MVNGVIGEERFGPTGSGGELVADVQDVLVLGFERFLDGLMDGYPDWYRWSLPVCFVGEKQNVIWRVLFRIQETSTLFNLCYECFIHF